MTKEKNRQHGEGVTVLLFLLSVLLLALLCAAGRALLGALTGPGALAASGDGVPSRRIVIDAGHGGEDGGTVGVNGVAEKEINLLLSGTLAEIFRAAGWEVVETRTDDRLLYDPTSDYAGRKKVLDLAGRRKIAEESGCALFVSIHQNSFPSPECRGMQVYCSAGSPESRAAAEAVRERVRGSLQPENDRAVKEAGSAIFLLDRLTCPAILVECGFLSNPEECALLCDDAYRQKLALCLYAAIASGMGP